MYRARLWRPRVCPAFIAFFSIDLFLSFFVAYHDMEGVWVISLRRIACHYVVSPQHFLVDLLAIIPFEEASEGGGALGLFKVCVCACGRGRGGARGGEEGGRSSVLSRAALWQHSASPKREQQSPYAPLRRSRG